MTISAPHWDLTNVYPSLESPEFKAAIASYKSQVADLGDYFVEVVNKTTAKTPVKTLAPIVGEVIDRINTIQTLSATIGPFIHSFVTTNSHDKVALKALSEFEQASLPMQQIIVQFKGWMGKLSPVLDKVIKANPSAGAHAFMLKEAAEQSKYLMSDAEEALAAELSLSGGNAFGKLQGTVTSQLSVDFELDGKMQKLPMPALINLRSHPDEDTRRRGYEAENKAWESVQETLAACLNGVKGEVNTLNKRRGRKDALHSSLEAARIDRQTLDAMLAAMQDSFPMFRSYFKPRPRSSARKSSPGGTSPPRWARAARSIPSRRPAISSSRTSASSRPTSRAFADRAFEKNWIDAEQRDGKRGGAFCMGVQGPKESRILCNFDGSFDQVSTLAHELGHAFHNECAYQADKTVLQQITPMTLAETASTMCETIVTEAVLATTEDPQEELAVLEAQIQGACAGDRGYLLALPVREGSLRAPRAGRALRR